MLRATRFLTHAAVVVVAAACLSFGAGDVSDQWLLLWLRCVQWTAIALGLALVVRQRSSPSRRIAVPVVIWLAALTVSAAVAPAHRDDAMNALLRPLEGVLLALAVYAVAASRDRWLALNAALAVGGLGIAVIGLAEVADVAPLRSWLASLHDGTVPIADVPRLTSLLSHPNVTASTLELTLPLLVALTFIPPRPWRIACACGVLLHLLALGLTFSRAGVIAAVAGLLVLVALAARRGARQVFGPISLVAVAAPSTLLVAAAALPPVQHRLLAELQQEGYRATYAAPPQVTVAPRQVIEVPVTVTNAGDSEWTALDASRVALGYHLLRADGTPLEFESPATLLPSDLPPNASLAITAHLRAPAEAGSYVVEWDALREGVAWFSWRGTPTLSTSLVVEPDILAPATLAEPEAVVLPRPGRIQYWLAAWAMLRDFPLMGVGLDNFRLRFAEYSSVDESHIGTHAHSLYFESLADSGVLGFAALCGFLLMLLRLALRGVSESADWLLRGALLASLFAWLIHGLVDDFERFLPTHLAFWIVVGLVVRGADLAQRSQRAE